MGESHLGTVDLDDPCTGGGLQAAESALPIDAAGADHRDRRLRKRRGYKENPHDLLRQPREPIAEQLLQVAGDAHRPVRGMPKPDPSTLTGEFQREVRIAGGDALEFFQLRPRQLEPHSGAEQPVKLTQPERLQRREAKSLVRERTAQVERRDEPLRRAQRREQPDGLVEKPSQRRGQHVG